MNMLSVFLKFVFIYRIIFKEILILFKIYNELFYINIHRLVKF